MIPNLYIKQVCFNNHPRKNCCLEYQAIIQSNANGFPLLCFGTVRPWIAEGSVAEFTSMGTAVWGFLAPFCLNFSFVLMPGWNLRDLVAAICNVYFVVFVCQFIWCFMCLQHFWRLPFEAPVLCLFIKLILVGHWGHFYFGFLPLCFSCVFSDKGRISPEFEPVAH